jgi:uncharacterized surface protein with fasciclin (FAS1) repeats
MSFFMQNFFLPSMMKINKLNSRLPQFLVVLLSICLFACSDDESLQPNTATDLIIEDPSLSSFYAAVKHADMVDALKSGNFTVFAPNNEAFEVAGYGGIAAITSLPKDSARNIIAYHIVPNERLKSDIITTIENTEYVTQSKEKLFVSRMDTSIYVNGAQIVKQDVKIDNGVVHIVNRVLSPPQKNIFQFLFSQPDLSFLTAAIVRSPAAVMSLLNSTTPYTLFVADNEAFTKSGYPTLQSVEIENPEKLGNIVRYNLVNGRLFSGSITGNEIRTVFGTSISVTTNNGIKLTGRGNFGQPAIVTQPNNVMKNGVIHYVDRLILP